MTSVSVLNGGRVPQNGLKMVSGYKEHHLCLSKMPERITNPGHETDNILAADGKLMLDEEEQPPASSEMRHMKELLLIHLDFIQQQSEQLTTKEKQIVDLMRENEMLKLRIDRMERRVALQRNRPSAAAGSSASSSSAAPGAASAENGLPRGVSPSMAGCSSSSAADHLQQGAAGPRKRRRRSFDSMTSSGRGKRLVDQSKRHPRLDSKRNRKRDDGDGSPGKKDNHLTTETAYYTVIGNQSCMWSPHVEYPSKEVLEVPRWRVKLYSSSYTMEGTENLSEDVFNRRHYRLSIDEKRRKRWDVQRIREQRQNERLRQREKMRQGGDGQEDSEFQSFWPQPHPSLVLSVNDTIPVSVFGIRLAATPVAEFSLPWLAGKESTLKSLRSFTKRKR